MTDYRQQMMQSWRTNAEAWTAAVRDRRYSWSFSRSATLQIKLARGLTLSVRAIENHP